MKLGKTLLAIGFLILIILSSFAIFEFTAREQFNSFLNQEMKYIENQIIPENTLNTLHNTDSLYVRLKNMATYRRYLNGLTQFGGGYKKITVSKIRYLFDKNVTESNYDDYTKNEIFSRWFALTTWPNEMLLIFASLLCGALGAIIKSFISPIEIKMTNILIGMSAAFVLYLAMRSGDLIFIISENDLSNLNPYSVSILSLLAGLFSNKVFTVLRNVIEKKFGEKLS